MLSKESELHCPSTLTPNETAHHINLPFSFHPTDEPHTRTAIASHLLDFSLILAELDPIKPNQTLLDIGAGAGWTTQFFNQCKLNAIALDISPHWKTLISKRNTHVPFIIGDAENMQFKNNSFNYITFYNSFHHMDNTKKVIEECYRILKPGGKVIFLEPGIDHTESHITQTATTRFNTEEHGINPFKLKKQCRSTGFSKSYIKSDYSIYPDINERHILTHFKGWIRDIILCPLLIIGSLKGRAFVVAQK